LVANESKATNRSLAASEGKKLSPLPSIPAESTDTRAVCPVVRSRTKMSLTPLVSPGTRLVASEAKATNWPSAEIEGEELEPLPWMPAEPTDTRKVCPVER